MAWNPTEAEYREFEKKRNEELKARGESVPGPTEAPTPEPAPEPARQPGTIRKLVTGVREGVSAIRTLRHPGEIAKRLPAAKKEIKSAATRGYTEVKKEANLRYTEAGGAPGIIRDAGDGALRAVQGGADRMIRADRRKYYKKPAPSLPKKKKSRLSGGWAGMGSSLPRAEVGFGGGASRPGKKTNAQPRQTVTNYNSLPGWGIPSASPKKKVSMMSMGTIPTIGLFGKAPAKKPGKAAGKKKPIPMFSLGPIPRIGFFAPIKKKGGK